MTDGSSRVSNEDPPALLGVLPPLTKLLTAAFLRYSSSTARRFRWRTKTKIPPAAAAITTIPTTTPATIAALLGVEPLLDELPEECAAGAVTTTVCPPIVTTDGDADVVAEVPGALLEETPDDNEPGSVVVVPVR